MVAQHPSDRTRTSRPKLSSLQLKIIASCLFVGVCSAPFLVALIPDKPEEQVFTAKAPVSKEDPKIVDTKWDGQDWYCVGRPDGLEKCYVQLILRADAYEAQAHAQEVSRYISQSLLLINDASNKDCYRQSQQSCLLSFQNNLAKEYLDAQTPQEQLVAIAKIRAWADAVMGKLDNGIPSPRQYAVPDAIGTFTNQVVTFYGDLLKQSRQRLEERTNLQYTDPVPQPKLPQKAKP